MKVTGLFSRFHLIAAILAGMLISAPVAAKGSADIFSPEYMKSQLVIGKTTPEQVIRIYGEPARKSNDVSRSGTSQHWWYEEREKRSVGKSLRGVSQGLLSASSILPNSVRSKFLGSGTGDALLKANQAAYELERSQEGLAQISGKNAAGKRRFSIVFYDGVLGALTFGD